MEVSKKGPEQKDFCTPSYHSSGSNS